jgi:GNAT superfamily N-acetyltransferase
LMVGDRADTDLDGARRIGWSTALVLSGVTRPADLPDLAAAPDHLLADVAGLLDPPGPLVRPAAAPEEEPAGRLLAATPGGTGRERTGPTPAERPVMLVAVDGGRVVGAVAVRRDGRVGRLEGPVVDPGGRGRLVGTRLLTAACIQARAAGLGLVVAPAGCDGFLHRLGFRRPAEGPAASLVRHLRPA